MGPWGHQDRHGVPALYSNDRDGVRTFNKCTIRIGAFVEFHVGFAQVVDRSQFLVIEVAACGFNVVLYCTALRGLAEPNAVGRSSCLAYLCGHSMTICMGLLALSSVLGYARARVATPGF